MTETGEDKKENLTNNKKPKSVGKLDFETLYDQLSEKNRILKRNKSFWVRKGNSQKYTCTLCNIGVPVSSNLTAFKTAVLAHIEDKYHKKRYASFIAKESTLDCPIEKLDDVKLCEDQSESISIVENTRSIVDILEHEEEEITSCKQTLKKGKRKQEQQKMEGNNNNGLVDFDSIYETFEKSNPVVKTSKQFIVKTENGRDYFCNLCKVLIFNSLNATEFRYNLWVHLNEESHREKLPNFAKVVKDFEKVIKNLTNALPACYKNEFNCFEVGPAFRFVKCSVCDMAVSTNVHRLENHLKREDHIKRKHSVMRGESPQLEPLNDRTRNGYRKLVVQLDSQFKKDIKYIQIGKIPGYVVCSLCSYVILPTQFYVQTHLESAVHAKNKTSNLVNRNSKFKIALKDLMNTLPDDLRGYNIFEETTCGLTCKRCDTTIPPTSYDLYTHINKERHACVSE